MSDSGSRLDANTEDTSSCSMLTILRSNSNFPLAEEREFISGNGTLSTLCRSERSLWGSGKLAPWAIRKSDYNISLFKNVPGIEICKTLRNGKSEGNS